ncbi:MAG: dihydroorotate dehydrogenase-like protein [Limisphaerales bacterium]
MDLSTSYLGLRLKSPIVPSASPLSEDLDNIKRMEDAGAGAIVLYSVFEEHIRAQRGRVAAGTPGGVIQDPTDLFLGIEDYLDHVQRAKAATGIPIIPSLNGNTPGGWVEFARQIEQAGADALELNLYSVPTRDDQPGADIEREFVELVATVKSAVRIPVAVKVSPYFTNFANMAKRFDGVGAGGLVLFNRFYQPDIELETLEVVPNVLYSTSMDLRLPLRWIAILFERIRADLAATSGVHHGTDVAKLILVGAAVTMVCSSVLRHGIRHIRVIEQELRDWMEQHEYESVERMRGCLSQKHCADPAAFERAQYIRAVGVHTLRG